MNKRSELLGNEPIGKLLARLSAPAILGMIVVALYNLVDTAFLGNSSQGTQALTALAAAFPIQNLLMAITLMFGVGAGAVFSVALGENDTEKVKAVIGNVYTISVISGIFLAIFCTIFIEPILLVFSTPPEIIPLAKDYLIILFFSNIAFMNVSISSNIFRAEGNAKTAMIIMAIGAGLNIILDPIFIYTFDMGVKGAALATAIGQISAIFYVIYYSKTQNTVVNLYKKYIKYS